MAIAATEPVSMQQAFDAAVKEHSEKTEHAAAAEASTEAKADQTPAQHTDTAAGASTETATTETNDLISDTDWQTLGKLDPAKQRAELNKRWTQKTQQLADERKALDARKDLLDALDTDAEGTVRQLAQQLGLTIAPTPQEQQTQTTATQIADDIGNAVKAALGSDLDFMAGPLANAIKAAVEPLIKSRVEEAVKPVQEQTKTLLNQTAVQETETTLQTFSQKHPDWKQHEPAMVKLGHTLQPGPHVSAMDYMEQLYRLVTYDTRIEKAAADAVTRLAKGAEAAEKQSQPVSESKVSKTPPANASIYDAYAAAKRGERWE
jgi:hypothetical protein